MRWEKKFSVRIFGELHEIMVFGVGFFQDTSFELCKRTHKPKKLANQAPSLEVILSKMFLVDYIKPW